MLFKLLAVAALFAATVAGDLTACTNAFNQAANTQTGDAVCQALVTYDECVAALLQGNTDLELSDMAEFALATAFADWSSCPVAQAAMYRPSVTIVDDTVTIKVAQNKDVYMSQYQLTSVGISDVTSRANALNDLNGELQSITQQANTVQASATNSVTSLTSFINSQAAAFAPIDSQISTLMSSGVKWYSTMVSSYTNMNSYSSTIQGSIATEENNLNSWQSSVLDTASVHRFNLQMALADDAADRVQIITEDQNTLVSSQYSIATAINGFIATENSRGVARSNSLVTDAAATSTLIASDNAAAVSSEVSRANVAADSTIAASPVKINTNAGSGDFTACSTEGQWYFSTNSKMWMVCTKQAFNQLFFLPVLPQRASFIRAGSRIFTSGKSELQLVQALNQRYQWIKCYDASLHGFSASTFHTNCNNKGATVTIVQASSGTIFGGYMDQSWTSRGGYIPSSFAFLFRVSSNVLGVVPSSYLSSPQYNPYAGYDVSSYCPTWGAATDLVMSTPCQSASFSPGYYTGPSYSNSYLAGASSVTVSKLEVYYRAI